MASRSVSPGGALLRASRVFSIPPPLPRPAGALSSSATFDSETATLPYPIHLSITTPTASLKRGDWGFKRPLPLRATTKTSTPIIRVEAIDTFEHITEFGSSADHAITLQKFQEIGLPLSVPALKRQSTSSINSSDDNTRKSVFEEDLDFTNVEERGFLPNEDKRWKFKGPWLAGKTEGEFNTYVKTEVRKRRKEFQEFLRKACANALTVEARQAADGGEMPVAIQASEVTDEQFNGYVKNLRNELAELYRLIRSFLDLPPSPVSQITKEHMASWMEKALTIPKPSRFQKLDVLGTSSSPYADSGPPKTHPSAGLAYSRTAAHTFNHPTWGPQKYNPPLPARVVMPKGAATGYFAPVLGVGGFVVDIPTGSGAESFNISGTTTTSKYFNRAKPPPIPGLLHVEPDKVGGSKTYVHPTHAKIDPSGRVVMSVLPGDEQAIAVLEGTTDQIPPPSVPLQLRTYTRSTGFKPIEDVSEAGAAQNNPTPAPARSNRNMMGDLGGLLKKEQ